MIYHQRNKRKKNFIKFFLIIFLFLIVLRLFNNSFAIQILNYPVNYVLTSTNSFLSPLKNSIVYFKSKKDLQEEIKAVRQENLKLQLSQLVQQSNIQDYESYVKAFGAYQTDQSLSLFHVIARPPFLSFDLLKITGDLSTHQVNDLVFYKDILIGKIIEKNDMFAMVQLFSSPEQKTVITVKDIQFEAVGLGGGRYQFEVAKDFQIQEGDIVSFVSDQKFILGAIELIETTEEELFKKVYFNIPFPISSISYVSVGVNKIYEQQNSNTN